MIKVLTTGGTIDCKGYNKEGKSVFFKKTLIPKLIKQCRCTIHFSIKQLMKKDSLDITDKDREKIFQACKKTREKQIIITHGTYTLPETARYLGKRIKNKTIIIIGSAIPYSKNNSDALFNFGQAVSAVQILKKGIYVTMNGRIFKHNKVKKNIEKQIFEKK